MSSLSSVSPAPSNQFWSLQVDLSVFRCVQGPHSVLLYVNDRRRFSHPDLDVVNDIARKEWLPVPQYVLDEKPVLSTAPSTLRSSETIR